MTYSELIKFATDYISDKLLVAIDDQYITYNEYKKHPAFESNPDLESDKLYILPVSIQQDKNTLVQIFDKFKSDDVIVNYRYKNCTNPIQAFNPPKDKWIYHFDIVLSRHQVENFGKKLRPEFDENTGYLIYGKHKCKFGKETKQYYLLKTLAENQGRIVSIEELISELYPQTGLINATLKNNLYDTYRKLKEKIVNNKIPEQVFMETNAGYGLKD